MTSLKPIRHIYGIKAVYEPYAYFERDRFYPMITDGFDKLLNGESPLPYKYLPQEKHIYHGAMSDKMLEKTMENYQDEFFNLPTEKFSKNVAALEKIINYCNDNNIRVRAVWMPWNTKLEQPELLGEVKAMANEVFDKYNVEVLDMETALSPECFYDTGHLNYDVGSAIFTQKIDEWL